MALNFMRYRPDTCGCVIIQTHDSADATIPIGLDRIESKCEYHANLTDQQVWDAVCGPFGENKRKNRVINHIKDTEGEAATWTWSRTKHGAVRTLVVTTGLTAINNRQIQTRCDADPHMKLVQIL